MTIILENELRVGRNVEGAGRLADDEEISRAHAILAIDSRGFCSIEDLGSTNGTFVNGQRISAPQPLSEGDTIELGGTTLVVRELLPPPTPSPPRPAPTVQTVVTGIIDIAPPREAPATPEPEYVIPADSEAEIYAGLEAAEPEPEPASDAEPGVDDATPVGIPSHPNLSLKLEVDFIAGQARLLLGGTPAPVVLTLDDGAWRVAPISTIEGDPA